MTECPQHQTPNSPNNNSEILVPELTVPEQTTSEQIASEQITSEQNASELIAENQSTTTTTFHEPENVTNDQHVEIIFINPYYSFKDEKIYLDFRL